MAMMRRLTPLSLSWLLCWCAPLGPPYAFSQYYSFGRNKVQYTESEWQVLSTALFDTASTVRAIDLSGRELPWEPKSIAGTTTVDRVRYEGDYSLDVAQSVISTDPVFGTSGGAIGWTTAPPRLPWGFR